MRLLNVRTLQLTEFRDEVPSYVAASHRWAKDEPTYQDFRKVSNTERGGFQKIEAFTKYIREFIPAVDWLWIDTCCVNTESVAELSESINSTFRWFRNAELCLAYLEDVEDLSHFEKSAWFKRAWTVQELLAPRMVIFVTKQWHLIGSKGIATTGYHRTNTCRDLEREISKITGIPEVVLHDFRESAKFSIDERLNWMKGRLSTREEDMAYALFGIFDVALGVNYGERYSGARRRLLAGIRERERSRNSFNVFHYSPLHDPRSDTRILNILETDDQGSPIRCSLSHASLHDPPEYVALSYHWGDSGVTTPILVSASGEADFRDAEFYIRTNLKAALLELRKKGVLSVWVDMICINQQDVFERNQQVTLMGKIYAKAVKVVAWAGHASDGSSAVVRAMAAQKHQSSSEDSSLTLNVHDVQVFLSRPYFTRMWIIQELAKAREAEIWCGQDIVQLEAFNSFVSSNQITRLISRQKAALNAIQTFCERESQSKIGIPRMLLSQALVASRSFVASDPRDNIYAIVGLTLDGEDVVAIPDYRRSVEDVFAAVSKQMIANQGLVSLILLARGSNRVGSKASWIPDWNEHTLLPPWIKESLCRERDTLSFSARASNDILLVSGQFIDDVWEELPQEALSAVGEGKQIADQERGLDMQGWLEKYTEASPGSQAVKRMIKNPIANGTISFQQPESKTREAHLLIFERTDLARYSMRLVRLKRRGFRAIYQDAEHGDQIWRLENCPLPVVLRPLPNGHFLFVGEIHVDTGESEWWQSVWTDFRIDDDMTVHSRRPGDLDFHQERSRTICIE